MNRHLHRELETPRRRRRHHHALGERLLVLDNHDRHVPALRRAGFHKTCRTALCATDLPLVLTHIPLLKVPAGAVNVHGHLHRAAGPTDRHVNGARRVPRPSAVP